MKFKSFLILLIVSVFIVAFTGTQVIGSQDKPVEDRVANLEMQVLDLTSRVLKLEKQLSANSTSQTPVNSAVPAGKAAWRKLQKGITRAQVRTILGEPKDIDMYRTLEVWHYREYSSVTFNSAGYVTGWDEP